MRDFTDDEEPILCRLVPTAQRLIESSGVEGLREWILTLSGTDCALLLNWAIDRNEDVRWGADVPLQERHIGQA